MNDAFLMDLENWCLERKWSGPPPTGRGRYLDPEWAEVMQSTCEGSDCTWAQYVEWVKAGGGDEWFMASS